MVGRDHLMVITTGGGDYWQLWQGGHRLTWASERGQRGPAGRRAAAGNVIVTVTSNSLSCPGRGSGSMAGCLGRRGPGSSWSLPARAPGRVSSSHGRVGLASALLGPGPGPAPLSRRRPGQSGPAEQWLGFEQNPSRWAVTQTRTSSWQWTLAARRNPDSSSRSA